VLRAFSFLLAIGCFLPAAANNNGQAQPARTNDCAATSRCARTADNLPAAPRTDLPVAPQYVPGSVVAPSQPVAPPAAKDFAEFVRRVSHGWCAASVGGNLIANTFSPDLTGLSDLNALANLGGFDHFNIEQDITDISNNNYPAMLPRWTGVDPAVGGNSYVQFDDDYPWYFNEVFKPGEWMPMYNNPGIYVINPSGQRVGLNWRDAPNMGPRNAGTTLTFIDYLVGVYPDHTGARISQAFPTAQETNFQWRFRQGEWGAKRHDRSRAPDGIEPGSRGSISFLGFFGNDPGRLSPASANACKAATEPGRLLPPRPSIKAPG